MHIPIFAFILAACAGLPMSSRAAPAGGCTSAQRIAGAQQIPYAYNLVAPGASEAAFEQVPFADDCVTLLNVNGLPAVQVANSANTTRMFADETRQVFSQVTGQYTDFSNGTTIIATNVTLGALYVIPIPVTFFANVFLTYNLATCLIEKVQAYATIPTQVGGQPVSPP